MKLRRLEDKDARGMVEWMSDPSINKYMQFNKNNISYENALLFIKNSKDDSNNLHMAIVNEKDEYLGTVSLKNIDRENSNAEFAIGIRSCAMGKGISSEALRKILEIAFNDYHLHKVYLYVRTDNVRAVKFYDKNKLRCEGLFKEHYCINSEYKDIKWYAIQSSEFEQ